VRGSDHGLSRPTVKISAVSIWMLWRKKIKKETRMEKRER
jgi:hypothetical protein